MVSIKLMFNVFIVVLVHFVCVYRFSNLSHVFNFGMGDLFPNYFDSLHCMSPNYPVQRPYSVFVARLFNTLRICVLLHTVPLIWGQMIYSRFKYVHMSAYM